MVLNATVLSLIQFNEKREKKIETFVACDLLIYIMTRLLSTPFAMNKLKKKIKLQFSI